jgi:hypothetical protein
MRLPAAAWMPTTFSPIRLKRISPTKRSTPTWLPSIRFASAASLPPSTPLPAIPRVLAYTCWFCSRALTSPTPIALSVNLVGDAAGEEAERRARIEHGAEHAQAVVMDAVAV